jgi:NAD(P)-dependent dehydrogenase (short-subunit alcohol dehydrogenase family)
MAESSLRGRTALVTGSTRAGIGAATALRLAAAGANVVLNYGSGDASPQARERANAFAAQVQERGREVMVVEADVKSLADVQRMFVQIRDRFTHLDILVNNAGATWLEQEFTEIDADRWQRAMQTEIDGVFLCMRAALPEMRRRRWGRIVNVCVDMQVLELLINAQYGHVLERYPTDFAIGKTGRQALTRLTALAEWKYGITINNILPGIIEDAAVAELLQQIPQSDYQRTYCDPLDVAEAVLWLCSPQARAVTGSDVRIPGNVYKRL